MNRCTACQAVRYHSIIDAWMTTRRLTQHPTAERRAPIGESRIPKTASTYLPDNQISRGRFAIFNAPSSKRRFCASRRVIGIGLPRASMAGVTCCVSWLAERQWRAAESAAEGE